MVMHTVTQTHAPVCLDHILDEDTFQTLFQIRARKHLLSHDRVALPAVAKPQKVAFWEDLHVALNVAYLTLRDLCVCVCVCVCVCARVCVCVCVYVCV